MQKSDNWNTITVQSTETIALTVLCQSYVIVDEEFSNNPIVKNHMNDPAMWTAMAEVAYGAMFDFLDRRSNVDNEGMDDGYDEIVGVTQDDVLNFIMDPRNRFEMNDILCDSIDKALHQMKKIYR